MITAIAFVEIPAQYSDNRIWHSMLISVCLHFVGFRWRILMVYEKSDLIYPQTGSNKSCWHLGTDSLVTREWPPEDMLETIGTTGVVEYLWGVFSAILWGFSIGFLISYWAAYCVKPRRRACDPATSWATPTTFPQKMFETMQAEYQHCPSRWDRAQISFHYIN